MKEMRVIPAIIALAVAISASAFTKVRYFSAVKYSLATQTTSLKKFGTKTHQAYKVQDNLTVDIENGPDSYSCDISNAICSVTAADTSNVHADASGSWIFTDEVTDHDIGTYTPAL